MGYYLFRRSGHRCHLTDGHIQQILLDAPRLPRNSTLRPVSATKSSENPGNARIECAEAAVSGSDHLSSVLAEIESYPGGFENSRDLGGVAVPLQVHTTSGRVLTFLTTVTTLGTALDLTAAELSIDAFLPADEATAAALR
jgi:hypothetical protein